MRRLAALALCALAPGMALAQGSTGTQPAGPMSSTPPGQAAPAPPAPPAWRPNLEGLTVTLGLGYGLGYGDLFADPALVSPFPVSTPNAPSSPSLDGNLSGQLPASIGLGYRPRPYLSFGLHLGLARIFLKNCPTTCASSDQYVGAEVRFHVFPERRLSPWVSLGMGYESFDLRFGDPYQGYSWKAGFTGYGFDLQVGADVRVTRLLTIGPYLGVRVGRFWHATSSDTSRGSPSHSADIPASSQTTHAWLAFGVRGTFTFGRR